MTQWLPAALLALLSFGFWGLFGKLAMQHIDSKSALFYQAVGVFAVGLVTLYLLDFKPENNIKGLSYGLLTGIASGAGCLFYLFAADRGKISTIVTMTALYPIITIMLSYFLLREGINIKQWCGIGFAIVAIYLLS